MFQPTTLAMYANIAAIVSLHRLRVSTETAGKVIAASVLLLSISTVILCQSRVGTILLVVSLVVWLFHSKHQSKRTLAGLLLLISLITILHAALPNYFSRFRSQSLHRGVTYRLDIYKTSAKDLVKHHAIIGNGPASLPTAINNQNLVPDDVAFSLHLGFNFISTHDLFFDFAYYFGLVAALALFTISVYAAITYIKSAASFNLAYLLVFVILFANAILNVPSLELTSMYFIVLFGLLANSFTVKSNPKVKLIHEV
jgi:hypothetical protein